ncbi:Neuroendocrine convertase 1 [Eufriesea mexicana]|nr:Neuroendocrine convertase 1 [Eufriesea mexicana]
MFPTLRGITSRSNSDHWSTGFPSTSKRSDLRHVADGADSIVTNKPPGAEVSRIAGPVNTNLNRVEVSIGSSFLDVHVFSLAWFNNRYSIDLNGHLENIKRAKVLLRVLVVRYEYREFHENRVKDAASRHRPLFADVYLWFLTCWIISSNFLTNILGHEEGREEWVVRIHGGPQVATLLALQSGYKHLGPPFLAFHVSRFVIQVLGFKDTYIWLKEYNGGHEKRGGIRLTKALNSSNKIIWADQQKAIERHKRDYVPLSSLDSEKPLIREKRVELDQYHLNGIKEDGRDWEEFWLDGPEDSRLMFNDELWDQEWYLQDTRSNKALPKLDLNVLPLYRLGVTGRGVRIAVLDDGLEYTHDDLRNNYDPNISYDVNQGDDDPLPRYELSGMNGHGTRCAGEIAMEANNRKCGVGVSFEASVGGIKLLDGLVNDRVEGEALGYKPELVDIYTASWGPADDGKSLEAPGRLATEALERGVTLASAYLSGRSPHYRGFTRCDGRNGKGSIYVWASGNGGLKSDDCGCDGYVGSIYTIAVGSASQTGRFPWYGESCPATLATTYSSGAYHDQMIATTDLRNTCTTGHTGTSASAPLAAGILALALQVNKDLTWRDVQHLVVWTSEYSPLRENPGWFKNSAGFWFNSRFGFGLMNAYALVSASSNWTTVPDKTICKVDVAKIPSSQNVLRTPLSQLQEASTSFIDKTQLHAEAERLSARTRMEKCSLCYRIDKKLAYGNSRRLRFEAEDECRSAENEITFLEHVEIEVSLEYSLRGALQIHLTAPSGTKVQLLKPRKFDDSPVGFEKWKFMSVASWGEDPRGSWFLDILDEIGPRENNGTIDAFSLVLHGTREMPRYRKNGPRIYNQDYNRIRNIDENQSVEPVLKKKLGLLMQETNDIYEKDWSEFL